MKKIPFMQTSVFTDNRYAFSGNQLATFWDRKSNPTDEATLLGITREMNYSESTFLFETQKKNCDITVRIFTPGKEIPYAGHPTLGTAYVLKEKGFIPHDSKKATLELGVGPIDVAFFSESLVGMYQPEPQFLGTQEDKQLIANILGISTKEIADDYPMEVVSTGFPFLIVPLNSLLAMDSISLNPIHQIKALQDFITQEIVVITTETIHEDADVHVRMFAPSAGVLEDPATGSAAGPTGAYLAKSKILENYTPEEEIVIEQGIEINRPSKLIVKNIFKGKDITQILVSGEVKKTVEGSFFL
jgi:trans-2,3-dihydro-3-hydroxyanthranilate isomerase